MKKIKLFALAAFAMLSTNVFAQSDGISATKVFTFNHHADGTAEITGFVADLDAEFKAAVAIPETVTHPTEKVGGQPVKYFVKEIADGAFAGEPIKTITFPAAVEEDEYTGIDYIGPGAFAKTNIQTLNLTNTIIETVYNLFDTEISGAPNTDKVNATLTSVTLPATVKTIVDNAFENCTKLATFNMSAAKDLNYIGVQAFAGCPIKNFDLSKNVGITVLEPNTLYDGVRFKAATGTVTVTLHKLFENLNNNFTGATKLTTVTGHIYVSPSKVVTTNLFLNMGEFDGCTALKNIDTKEIVSFSDYCFNGCTALASVDISKATYIGERAFAGTALKSVSFPKEGLNAIGNYAYFECASLTSIKFNLKNDNKTEVTTIGEGAFGYTGIASFELPAKNEDGFTIGEKAFVGCSSLKDFTYAPAAITADASTDININAFARCSKVAFHTTKALADDWRNTYAMGSDYYNGPANTKFDYKVSDGKTKFTLTQYKSNSKKYYVKWNGYAGTPAVPTAIKIKKGDAKVYSAFVDGGDGSLNLSQYTADDGYIYVKEGDVALIVTENADLTWEAGIDGYTTSWQDALDWNDGIYDLGYVANGKTVNALKYVTEATTRASLEAAVPENYSMFGWVNTSAACGFQKIASGTTIKAGVLFAWATPAAGGRLTVKWYDENGNLEAETTAIDAEATAINGVKAAEAEGQRYNVAGQKVSASYKGLVIKDGKKYMQK